MLQPFPPVKKKRNLPGTPDPSAEVIALSPTTLMASNRFVCEICNKGFQRDQNLQLHRRGHNLPWKLRQRTSTTEVRKRVYICPETSCVHHNPSRALGDLTGIKKHFCRKHGEKKWKCDKCSKNYAVQSDWKAHSKTCGTREYKCHSCGTTFSRRDSFITHRAFCDALAEENNNPTATNPNNFPELMIPIISGPGPTSDFKPHNILDLKCLTMAAGGPTSALLASAHMSATALLQKAAQMGATASGSGSSVISGMMAGTDTRLQYTVAGGGYGDGGMGLMVNQFFHGSNNIDGGMVYGSGGNNLGFGDTMTVDFLGVGGARTTAVSMQQQQQQQQEGGMDEFEGMGGSRLLGFHQFQQQM